VIEIVITLEVLGAYYGLAAVGQFICQSQVGPRAMVAIASLL